MSYVPNPALSAVCESSLKKHMARAEKMVMQAMALPKGILDPPQTDKYDALMGIVLWHPNAAAAFSAVMITEERDA